MEARYLTDLEWRICHAVNIYVFKNGMDAGDTPALVHIPPSKKKNMKSVLNAIEERVKFPIGYAAVLYKMDGKKVRHPCELEMYNNYVVASNYDKHFKCAEYGRKRSPLLVLNRESKHIRVLRLQNQNYNDWMLKRKAIGEERPQYIYPTYYTDQGALARDLPDKEQHLGNYAPSGTFLGCGLSGRPEVGPAAGKGDKTYRVDKPMQPNKGEIPNEEFVVNTMTLSTNSKKAKEALRKKQYQSQAAINLIAHKRLKNKVDFRDRPVPRKGQISTTFGVKMAKIQPHKSDVMNANTTNEEMTETEPPTQTEVVSTMEESEITVTEPEKPSCKPRPSKCTDAHSTNPSTTTTSEEQLDKAYKEMLIKSKKKKPFGRRVEEKRSSRTISLKGRPGLADKYSKDEANAYQPLPPPPTRFRDSTVNMNQSDSHMQQSSSKSSWTSSNPSISNSPYYFLAEGQLRPQRVSVSNGVVSNPPRFEHPPQYQHPPPQYQNPHQQYQNPPQQYQNPPPQYQNPPQQYQNSPQQYQNSPQQYQNPPQQFQHPLMMSQNVHLTQGYPDGFINAQQVPTYPPQFIPIAAQVNHGGVSDRHDGQPRRDQILLYEPTYLYEDLTQQVNDFGPERQPYSNLPYVEYFLTDVHLKETGSDPPSLDDLTTIPPPTAFQEYILNPPRG